MTEEFWSAGGLHGTFMQPANRAPRGPAVLIIAGSGPTDRNGNGPGLSTDTYKLLAEQLCCAWHSFIAIRQTRNWRKPSDGGAGRGSPLHAFCR